MWTYRQAPGCLYCDGAFVSTGYSGAGAGKNNPAQQATRDVGPIPQGKYKIHLQPQCTSDLGGGTEVCMFCGGQGAHKHGPFVLRLDADPSNEMFERDGFLIHGDSIAHPGMASEGCIVVPRTARWQIAASGDAALTVTP